jgi:hypothetical protein
VTAPAKARTRAVWTDFRVAVLPWMVARVLVVSCLALARHIFEEVGRRPRPIALSQGLFAWDGAFYRAIAEQGYDALSRQGLRFFPLVPIASRALGWVFLGHEEVALIVISNLSALAFGMLLHRLALRETGDEGVARRAAWFAALFPAVSVFVMGYADATSLALSVGMFLALRSRRFVTAGVLGYLAALTRPLGVLLVIPALIEAARDLRGAPPSEVIRRTAAVAGPPLGLATFMAWVEGTRGDAFLPFSVQKRESLRGDFVDPVSRLIDAGRDLFDGDRLGSGLHLLWALLFIGLLVVVARRLPASYTAFTAATLLVTLSAENLDSFERYALGAFPLVVALAIVTGRVTFENAALTLAAGGLVGYSVLVFLGVSVP